MNRDPETHSDDAPGLLGWCLAALCFGGALLWGLAEGVCSLPAVLWGWVDGAGRWLRWRRECLRCHACYAGNAFAANVSHGYCPHCLKLQLAELAERKNKA